MQAVAGPLTGTIDARTKDYGRHELSGQQAVGLQLLPGLATLAAYTLFAAVTRTDALPSIVTLGLAMLVGEVPVSWAIIIRRVRAESGGSFSLAAAFPWRRPLRWWRYLVVGIPVIVYSMTAMFGLIPVMAEPLRTALFGWVPDWFVMTPDVQEIVALPRAGIFFVWLTFVLVMVGAGGVTQELYSRGFLLPRTEHLGLWAPLLNALAFAVFHMNSPWSWPVFFLGVLPWAYMVWWHRSIKIGLFGHIGVLGLQAMAMMPLLFGYVPVPAGTR